MHGELNMDEERLASLKELGRRLGHQFNEMGLLDRALTHRSFVNETDSQGRESNEVLEFLGDSVLNLAVSYLLHIKFPEAPEGVLSMYRAHLVKQSTLAHLSRELRLEEHLLLGKGERLNGGMKKSSILGNAYEALIGAIFSDAGFNLALEIIRQHFEPYLQTRIPSVLFDDFKSLLQIHTQQSYGVSPRYRVLEESGPEHNKRFQASVLIKGEVIGMGWGKSKKKAEQEAAKSALEKLETRSTKFETNSNVQNTNDLSK